MGTESIRRRLIISLLLIMSLLAIPLSKESYISSIFITRDREDKIINMSAVNQPPVISVPPDPVSYTENDGAVSIFPITVFDPDAGNASIQVNLTSGVGLLTVVPDMPNGATSGEISGSGTTSLVIIANYSEITTTLASLTYDYINENPIPSDIISIYADDLGNNGTGGPMNSSAVIPIDIMSVNDPPVLSVPAAQVVNEDTNLSLSGPPITVSDVDASIASIELTLSASNGILTVVPDMPSGATNGEISGSGTKNLVITASQSKINTTLTSLVFTPDANYNGPDTINLLVDDLGNSGFGGPLTSSDSISITVNSVNDGPSLTIPGPQTTNERTDLNILGLQISDVDSNSNNITLNLITNNGILILDSVIVGGASESEITGNATNLVIINSTANKINKTLSSLVYRPDYGFSGEDAITLNATDNGFTGLGGPMITIATIIITVLSNPPVISSPPDISFIFGSTGNKISWMINDTSVDNPTYLIYRNSFLIINDTWTPGEEVVISLDGLSVGSYNYTIVVFDGFGNSISDEVLVNVSEDTGTDEVIPAFPILYLFLFVLTMLLMISINLKRKKEFTLGKSVI